MQPSRQCVRGPGLLRGCFNDPNDMPLCKAYREWLSGYPGGTNVPLTGPVELHVAGGVMWRHAAGQTRASESKREEVCPLTMLRHIGMQSNRKPFGPSDSAHTRHVATALMPRVVVLSEAAPAAVRGPHGHTADI